MNPQETAAPTLADNAAIQRGTCYCLFAYDIGASIDLEVAQRHIADPTNRETIPNRRRAPEYFDFKPAPLRVTQHGEWIALGDYVTDATVNCVIFDFGALEVVYTIDIAGPMANLSALSNTLYGHAGLLEDAHRRMERLVERLDWAVTKRNIAPLVEDYVIYHIDTLAPASTPEQFISRHATSIAQVLRSGGRPLSADETRDALASAISYSPDDVAIIDWQSSLLLGQDMDDVRAVLEFANVELLEMRFLDDQLDRVLNTFYQALDLGRWRPSLSSYARRTNLRRLARLQMESAILFEEVNNALKLLGDQFLARVYRLASKRLHLPEWDASIIRKLETIESLYSKLADFQNSRRLELLEWIIILLIAISIGIAFLPS